MSLLEKSGLSLLRRLDPETAHQWSLRALNAGLVANSGPVSGARLKVSLAGMELSNPIGLAAGFDKNAEAVTPLSHAGFGFIEVGGATPRPQPGNPRPRVFRLPEDRAVINRFGFNNDGAERIAERLANAKPAVPVGLNIGANKDSEDRSSDYSKVLKLCGPFVDFATVNVSSPNTERLRDLQGPDALRAVLDGVLETRAAEGMNCRIFLKIAPDLSDEELAGIAKIAMGSDVDAIIATNTTIGRPGLRSANAGETGGLSGAPLFELSTRVLARLAVETGGAMPLVGVGGVSSAADAYQKILAGATAVQLYTALIYEGLSLVGRIGGGLADRLARDGYTNVSEAVGKKRAEWAQTAASSAR